MVPHPIPPPPPLHVPLFGLAVKREMKGVEGRVVWGNRRGDLKVEGHLHGGGRDRAKILRTVVRILYY